MPPSEPNTPRLYCSEINVLKLLIENSLEGVFMSGHSKWSQIKRQKGVADVKRGAAFTKAANAITIAAKQAGGSPDTNFKLRLTIDAARRINMPKENIERAIARGAGGREGLDLEEITYEGFGPAGVALIVEAVTDNRSRTTQEVRSIFERSGGNLSSPGAVSHLFTPTGEITVNTKTADSDRVLLAAAEAGADDIETGREEATVYTTPISVEKVKEGLTREGFEIVEAKISRKPISIVKINDENIAASVLSLVSKLDDLDDVQRVDANFDISEDVI